MSPLRLKISLLLTLGVTILSLTILIPPGYAGWLDVVGSVGKIGGSILGGGSTSSSKSDDDFDSDPGVIVTSGEDIMAKALDQIKLGEKIAAKTREMESEVEKVFVRIRTYQAMQGALWFNLGKSYYELRKDLLDLDLKGGCSSKEFCRRTKQKRISQIRLFNQVEIKTVDGLVDAAETIKLNNKTNLNLRRSVNDVIAKNPLLAFGFTEQIQSQNRSLNTLLQAYTIRVGDIYLAFNSAENTFKKIATEFSRAEKDMGAAIKKYNQQSGLVAAEATKHVGIMALHAAKLSALLNDHSRSFWQNIQLGAQVANILKRVGVLTKTLNQFSKTRKKFARNSATIKEAGARAREEIIASGITIRSLRKKLNQSWNKQISAINKAATKEKLKVKNLKIEMAALEKKNRKQVGRMYAKLHKEAKAKADKAFGKPVF
ncbi:MAG: hypothetical protein J7M09_04270 [Deltaproteobacteria bacterium]|nr:hypothetical protein [Candidatus Tharpella sp.]